MMQKQIEVIETVDADAGALWSLLEDFGGFLSWAGSPQDEIRNEGEGIGMIRHLKMSGSELAERMTECDASTRTLAYDLVYGEPIGMQKYQARIRVASIAPGKSELIWQGEFDPVVPGSQDQVAVALAGAYQGMTQALAQAAKAHQR